MFSKNIFTNTLGVARSVLALSLLLTLCFNSTEILFPKEYLTHIRKEDFFDRIKFICLEEHQEKYQFFNGFVDELEELGLGDKSSVIFLEESTSSQSETVYQAIKQDEIEGFIFIKDRWRRRQLFLFMFHFYYIWLKHNCSCLIV